jgi:hypothetical protein
MRTGKSAGTGENFGRTVAKSDVIFAMELVLLKSDRIAGSFAATGGNCGRILESGVN